MSNDSSRPVDRQLAAEIHEAVRADTPSLDLSSDDVEDATLPNLDAVEGPERAAEDRAIVGPEGPLVLSSVTADAYPEVSTFFRIDSPTGETGDFDAGDVAVREYGTERDVRLADAGETMVDVVFVFDDAGSMFEEIVGAHAAMGEFVSRVRTAGIDARFALISSKESIEIRRDFTTDRAAFVEAVGGLSGSLGDEHRSRGIESIGVATGHTADGAGGRLSPFREGAHRVIVSVTDGPALVTAEDSTDRDARTVEDVGRFRAVLGGYTFLEIADVPQGYADDPTAAPLFAPTAGGTWFERMGTSADAFASFLTEDVPDLLAATHAATFTSDASSDRPDERPIRIDVDDPEAGSLSTTGAYRPSR